MAKSKKKETANLFGNQSFSEFEIEGEIKEDKITKEENMFDNNNFPNSDSPEENLTKVSDDDNVFKESPYSVSDEPANELTTSPAKDNNHPIISANQQVTSDLKKDSIESFDILLQPLIEKALKVVSITTDDENSNARLLGKELAELKSSVDNEKKKKNRPLKAEIDLNIEKAKKIIEPLDLQIDRIKNLITNWEVEKENKRKEELAKLEKEKKEREEKERLETERVNKIRNEIQRVREISSKSINSAPTLADLTKISNNLIAWKPKKEFFMEFFDEVDTTLRNDLSAIIAGRMPILKELDEQQKKSALLENENKEAAEKNRKLLEEKLANEKLKTEQEELLKKANEDSAELMARNELTVLVASLGVKDFEAYLTKITTKYGNCRSAVPFRDQIIKSFQEEQEQAKQVANLDAQKMKNQRVDYIFTISEESKVPLQYYSIDESKIKAAIQANRPLLEKDINSFKIDGVIITSKTQTVLKK